MTLRRLLSITLTLFIILSCILSCGIPASAAVEYTVYSDSDIQAIAGKTIAVPIYISNNSGLMGYDMSFTYDDKALTPTSVTRGNIMTDGFFEDDIEGTTSTDTSFRVFWSHAYPSVENGIMFYLNFNVSNTAMGSTTIHVGYDITATYDGNFDDVTLNCSDINIAITNNEYGSNPIFTLSGNNISAGEQLNLDISVDNIGELKSVKLSIPYNNTNFKYSGITVNGVTATAADKGSDIEVTISNFSDKTNGKKLTVKFLSETFATSGKYLFTANYNDLSGVDRILVKSAEITVEATETSDSIVIYTDDAIKTEFGQEQLIVPLYIKHNTGLLGYTLTFEYDDTVLEAVSAKAGSTFTGSFSNNIGKDSNKFTCLWFGNDDIKTNGDFITLTFNVLADKETNGEITISYNEKDIISETVDGVKISVPTINYKVNEVLLSSISIKQMPAKTTYFIGQLFDPAGLQIDLNYNDGSTNSLASGFSTSGFNSAKAGTNTITVEYQGKTTIFNVTIKHKSLDRISVSKMPTKTTYFLGQALDTTGLELNAEYDDGSTETVKTGFTTNAIDTSTAGEKTVTVTYNGKTTTFMVTYKQKSLTRISVNKQPDKTSYYVSESLDTTGLELKVEYDDGSFDIVTSGFATSDFDSSTVGIKTLTVIYGSKTATISISVIESTSNILGDTDGDGTVTIIDATYIQRKLASIPTPSFNEKVSDTDGDGILTILDATYIQRWLAELPSNEMIGQPID